MILFQTLDFISRRAENVSGGRAIRDSRCFSQKNSEKNNGRLAVLLVAEPSLAQDFRQKADQALVAGTSGPVGVTAQDNRRFGEAVLYRYRAGIPWRDLPERFGDGKNTHRRFSRWARAGVWERVFEHLAADGHNQYAMIDNTMRAHQHSAGALKKS